MERRERLMATLQGEAVDRPAVCFYEINGLDEKPDDPDPYNIYSDPSWKPLLDLARDRSDRIVMRDAPMVGHDPDPIEALTTREVWEEEGSRLTSAHTDAAGKASLRVPDLRCFDLRVSGGWTIPVMLRFRA